MKKAILFLIVLFFVQNLTAQQEEKQCPCCSEFHNSFDFWIGDWTVYDSTAEVVGSNTIEKQYDNCVL